MVILDTDHVSVLDRAGTTAAQQLRNRLRTMPENEVATSVVTYEEQMRGWLSYMAAAKSVEQWVEAYRRLEVHIDNYRLIRVVGFTEGAAVEFQRLRRAKVRLGTMDLRIASVALAHNALLLSRNLADFRKVPGLKVENWAD